MIVSENTRGCIKGFIGNKIENTVLARASFVT